MTRLTQRETQVMQMTADGLSARDIAAELGISHRTVEIHRKTAIAALGGKNATHAAVLFDRERRA